LTDYSPQTKKITEYSKPINKSILCYQEIQPLPILKHFWKRKEPKENGMEWLSQLLEGLEGSTYYFPSRDYYVDQLYFIFLSVDQLLFNLDFRLP
jgi:hypothetical protein